MASNPVVARLAAFRGRMALLTPCLAGPSPILLYQELFGLVHDLKSTVGLSEIPEVTRLAPVVGAADAWLRPLALGSNELAAPRNQELLRLALDLRSIDQLGNFLGGEAGAPAVSGRATPELPAKLQGLSYSWDALSKARAMSCHRHGYVLFEASGDMPLRDVTAYEEALEEEIHARGAIGVARLVEPRPGKSPPGPEGLVVHIRDLVAFQEDSPSEGRRRWKKIRTVSGASPRSVRRRAGA